MKRRRPWLAGVLSLLAPGVGQFYNGKIAQGWWFFAGFCAVYLANAAALPVLPIKPAVALLGVSALTDLALRVVAAIAAFRQARRVGEIQIGPYQHSWVYILLIVLMPIVNEVAAPEYQMQLFSMPSGSMIPELLVGDRFIVDRAYYRENPVQRGDVVVFKLPTDNSTDYVKRIVGLPGDRIQMQGGNLYINDQPVPRRPDEDCREQGAPPMFHGYVESLPRRSGETPVDHCIVKIGDDGPLDNTPVYDVPQGHYFSMGDNRDNSLDSRALSAVGYIPTKNMVGRVELIFFSTDGSAQLWEVWKWPSAIRYGRLFAGVR